MGVRWPWTRRQEPAALLSISDPALAAYFSPGGRFDDLAGVTVGEASALGLSAFFRAVSLISGTLASLPFRSYRDLEGGQREKVASVFDNPDGDEGQTPYEWKETAFLHLLLHGRAGALKVKTEAGGLVRLDLVHPFCFRLCVPTPDEYESGKLPVGGVWFDVTMADGSQTRLDADDFWYVPGMSLDGIHGISILTYARLSLGTAIAGDKAQAKMFSTGAMLSGIVTPDEDGLEPDEVKKIRRELDRNVLGHENAGNIAIVNRNLKFTPWTLSAVDAQFLQSRQFQIEEISRWTGVPPHLLMQTDKQTSWGTGIEQQNIGLGRTVLLPWSQRFEQRASRLLARPRWVEFDFAGLERPNVETEIALLIQQVSAGLLTLDEARAIRNLPPLPKAEKPAPPPAPDPEEVDDDPAAQ